MQLTNLQVLNALQALNSLSQQKLPVRLGWKINTALGALQPFAKATDEPLSEIRTRYAIRDEKGNLMEAVDNDGNKLPNTIQIPNDKIELVNQEINDFLAQTVEVLNVEFKLSEFPETLEIEPSVLNGLTPLIKDEQAHEISLVK